MSEEQSTGVPGMTLVHLFSELQNAVGRYASTVQQDQAREITVQELFSLLNSVGLETLLRLRPEDPEARFLFRVEIANGMHETLQSIDAQIERTARDFNLTVEDPTAEELSAEGRPADAALH